MGKIPDRRGSFREQVRAVRRRFSGKLLPDVREIGRLERGERGEEYSTERDLAGGSDNNWRWWCGGRYTDGDGEPVAIRS